MELEPDGADGRFVVSVEDVSGAWGVIKPLLEARPAWRGLQLWNKFGKPVSVPELRVQYMLSNNPRLKRLRQHAQSPVSWFRNPYVQLILISGDDPDEYKRTLKGQLRGVLEQQRDPLGGTTEFVIAYVQPTSIDTLSKGAKKVFESMRHDLGTRRRERCVRLDVGPRGAMLQASLNDLERQLADALRATFEARQAAYDEEVRKLTAGRQEPGWSFSTLFLVKDSLAIMLESASLLDDALREYAELEALFLETLPQPAAASATPFGGTSPGDDNAQLVSATWREMRQSVLRNGMVQFDFQQFLFACQARILLKLNRPAEVAERGLKFIQTFVAALDRQAAAGRLPPLFKETWTFSASVSLASTTVRIGPPPPTPTAQTPQPAPHKQASLPPLPSGIHRRATSELAQDAPPDAGGATVTRHTKSLSAKEFAAISEGSTGETSSMSGATSGIASDEEGEEAESLRHDARQLSVESATAHHRKSLRPVNVGHNNRSGIDTPGSIANGRPPGNSKRQGFRRHSTGTSSWKLPAHAPEVNWQLGVSGHLLGDQLEEGLPGGPAAAADGDGRTQAEVASARQRHFWCLLGHLYAQARQALSALGDHLELSESSATSSPRASLLPAAHNGTTMGGTPTSEANGSVPQASTQQSLFGSGHIVAPPARGEVQAARQPSPPPPLSNTSIATVESAISTPKHELASRSSGEAALPPPHHARRLSRFGLEAVPRRSDSTSSMPPGHSRRSSVSEVSTGAYSEAESVGSLVRRSSDPDIQRPVVDLSNIHNVEREVETASEDSESPSSLFRNGGEAFEASKRSLPWLTEWRLKLALTSTERYQELWMELSGCAAACYTAAGWRRTGELVVSGLAEILAQRGQLAASVAAQQRQARLFLSEGWLHQAARLLHELLDCQHLLSQAAIIGVCLRLLSLPDEVRGPSELLKPVTAALLEAAREQAALNAPAPSLAGGGPDGTVHCMEALWIEPLGGRYSRFFGQSEADGEPLTSASRRESGHGDSGAPHACVGDVIRVPVSVVSRLPEPVTVSGFQLAISILQGMTVVISPRGNENLLARGQPHQRTPSLRSLDSPGAPPGGLSGHRLASSLPEVGTPGTAASTQDAGQQHIGTKWQETDEVACSLAGGGARGEEPPPERLTLHTGANTLWCEINPLKRGLYTLKHATLTLGSLKLRLASHLPEMGGPPQSADTGPLIAQPRGMLGACDIAGRLGEEAVLVHIDTALQRVGTSAVAAHACLTAGLPQWLGIALAPKHDRLEAASIQVTLLGGHSSSAPFPAPGKGPVSLEAEPDSPGWILPLGSSPGSAGRGEELAPEKQARGNQVSDSGEASSSGRPAAGQEWRLGPSCGGELPAWVADQPCLLWLRVLTGALPTQHEVVRISPLGSHMPLRILGTDLPSPVRSPPAQDLFSGPKGAAEVDVNLDYMAGCQRGHSSRLTIPVSPPFRMRVTGKELPGRRVALQVQATSCLSCTATITGLTLDPQPGFSCGQKPPELASLLPLTVAAHGSAHLLLFLSVCSERAPDRGHHSRLNSSLELRFKQAAEGCPAAALQEVGSEWMPPLLANYRLPGPPKQRHNKPAEPDRAEAVQKHSFALDLGAASTAPRSMVYIRLLGPFSARVGEIVTFCWRLERSQDYASTQEGSLLQYEGDDWRPSDTRTGFVRLPLPRRSTATVEATWVPVSAGMLPMPQLLLPDIPHQEVFDVGDSNHLITVV